MAANVRLARFVASIAIAFGLALVPSIATATLVSYDVVNGFQSAWTGTFDVASLASPIGTGSTASPAVTAVTAVDSTVNWSFAPTAYSLGPTSDIGPFVQWAGNSGVSRFEIYSSDFYTFVSNGGTWSDALGQTFAITTIVYYLDAEVAQLFSDGGSLVFPVPEPSTFAMALAGLAYGGHASWRRRRRASSQRSARSAIPA